MFNCFLVKLFDRPCAIFPTEHAAYVYVSTRLASACLNQSDFIVEGTFIGGVPF